MHKAAEPDFKKFRRSAAFTAIGQGAAIFARKILKLCSRYDHPFAATDIAQLLVDFEAGVHDLNDGLLLDTCRQRGWKLVTHDGDCTSGGIDVLTSNPRLIVACR